MKPGFFIAGMLAALAAASLLPGGVRAGDKGQLGGTTTREIEGLKAFTFPAANLQKENQRPFFFGNRLFNTNWATAPASVKSFDGLGPLFNRVSCSGCHTQDGRGAPPEDGQGPFTSMLIRLSVDDPSGSGKALPHPIYGDQLSDRAIGGLRAEGIARITREAVPGTYGDGQPYVLERPHYEFAGFAYGDPGEGLLTSPRVAPQVIGLGLLEAVPEADIMALADPDDRNGDGISGRANRMLDPVSGKMVLGRFGWKANQPNLMAQNAGAAFGDIGLTSELHPSENCSGAQADCLAAPVGDTPDISMDFLKRLTLYTQLLAVPAQRNPLDPQVIAGQGLFSAFGCEGCHRTEMRTGPEAELSELRNQVFHPYTDLLLHDMGEALADNRPDQEAGGSEWRTPPLWGIGLFAQTNGHQRLLHDGRARGPAEAVLWHGGEATAARERFRNASQAEREALVRFLNSL
jgi:CxxC motif-containing protein (DUF1111 family)